MPHSRRSSTTIAILGGNTASGSALALLLRNVGYVTWNLDAPLRGADTRVARRHRPPACHS